MFAFARAANTVFGAIAVAVAAVAAIRWLQHGRLPGYGVAMLAVLTAALGTVLLGGGAVLLVIAAWGVVALPDALSRQHAATKAGTLAVALVCAGAAFAVAESSWTWRLLLIIGFLLATLPVASNLLARAAVREAGQEADAARAPVVGSDAGPAAPGSLPPRPRLIAAPKTPPARFPTIGGFQPVPPCGGSGAVRACPMPDRLPCCC